MRDKKRLRQCINKKSGFKSENNEVRIRSLLDLSNMCMTVTFIQMWPDTMQLVLTFASMVQDIWSGSVKSYKPKVATRILINA